MASSNPCAGSAYKDASPLQTVHADAQDSQSLPQEHLPSGYEKKTAYYNRASEKSVSHAEAKMIYRRHILDASDHDAQKPLKRIRTSPSIGDNADSRSTINRMCCLTRSLPRSQHTYIVTQIFTFRSFVATSHLLHSPRTFSAIPLLISELSRIYR